MYKYATVYKAATTLNKSAFEATGPLMDDELASNIGSAFGGAMLANLDAVTGYAKNEAQDDHLANKKRAIRTTPGATSVRDTAFNNARPIPGSDASKLVGPQTARHKSIMDAIKLRKLHDTTKSLYKPLDRFLPKAPIKNFIGRGFVGGIAGIGAHLFAKHFINKNKYE